MLETVDVSATRTDDIPGKAALLDESDVKDTGAVHPAELMDQVPGVWISRGGGQDNLTTLRSAVFTGPGSCGEFLFAEDGVPVRPSGFCNVNQFIEINSEQAGGIEVLSGTSAGSFYGANAIHGVINTLSLPLEERHSLRLEGGPNDYARMLWQEGDDDSYLALNTAHDGGYVDSSGYDQQKMSWKQRQQFSDVSLTHYLTAAHLDHQRVEVFFDLREVEFLELFGVVEIGSHWTAFRRVLMKDFEVQLVRPPVAVSHGSGCGVTSGASLRAHHGAFADVIHRFIGFLLGGLDLR